MFLTLNRSRPPLLLMNFSIFSPHHFHAIVRTSVLFHLSCSSLFTGVSMWYVGFLLWLPAFLMVAWDIRACVSGLAGSQCTTLAAVPYPLLWGTSSSHFYLLGPGPEYTCLIYTRPLGWESEICICLGRTAWISSALFFFAQDWKWP